MDWKESRRECVCPAGVCLCACVCFWTTSNPNPDAFHIPQSSTRHNQIGTCQMAMVAKTYNKPLYVAAESYKFARLYPLTQADLETNIDNDSARPLPPPYAPGTDVAATTSAGNGYPQQAQPDDNDVGEPIPGPMQRSRSLSLSSMHPAAVSTLNPSCDYTPANYISLLFTDLGILTPAAVSDELIKLYQ